MLVVRNARVATMTGPQNADGEAPLAILENGSVGFDGDRIVFVGRSASAPPGERSIDAEGALLTPGLVDPHTHLVFAGDRSQEHAQRLAGATYLQIAQSGGGIRSTVQATRDATDEELLAGLRERLSRLVRSGVTTVEVKTGYGLSVEQELRLLKIARAAGRGAGCDVAVTLLALHAVPPALDRAEWVRQVVQQLTPEAAREGARGCDAFFEKGAFDARECRAALEAGAQAGLVPHLHADQLSASGGAQLAAELECASADHLERITQQGIAALARAGTAAVLLPLAAWFLREAHPAQARPLLDAGVTVALGSNINPGSQRIESVSMLLAAGCLIAGLTPAQALWACTAGAARALRLDDRGVLKRGARADLVLFATKDPAHLPYHAGVEHARLVVHGGQIVHDARSDTLHCN
ncbi:MAG TPA: imidazolonepropionase [Myxococcales bacterium]|nr:imidazolonepropionase [Myxococcales bacterium]